MSVLWTIGIFALIFALLALYERFWSEQPDPPSEDELAPLRALSEELRLPLTEIVPGAAAPAGPLQSRIGGPFWRPDGVAPPRDNLGKPLIFLAQVNFADMAPLQDFPDRGLLQLFAVALNGLGGVVEVDGKRRDFHLDWWPEPEGGTLAPQEAAKMQPFRDRDVFRDGRAVRFKAGSMAPTIWDWRLRELAEKLFPDRFIEYGDTGPTHYLGGHPDYWQLDPRDPKLADADVASEPIGPQHDRVLLHVGCDDGIEIGDGGMINVLIPAAALRRRDFAQAVFYWDCG